MGKSEYICDRKCWECNLTLLGVPSWVVFICLFYGQIIVSKLRKE